MGGLFFYSEVSLALLPILWKSSFGSHLELVDGEQVMISRAGSYREFSWFRVGGPDA